VHGYRWLFGPTYPYVGSYHAVSGSLDPAEAVALLDSLHLPADTDHLLQLYAVLLRGVANHYRTPPPGGRDARRGESAVSNTSGPRLLGHPSHPDLAPLSVKC
jgi:hypothetical protein